jgi:hypothetical protein
LLVEHLAKLFEKAKIPSEPTPIEFRRGSMFDNIVALYCITDDLLKAIGHKDDQRRELSDAEVITTACSATLYFGSNLETARTFMKQSGLMPRMLSKSRLCRRLHQVEDLTVSLFHQLGWVFKQANASTQYLLDAFPVEVCDNVRISRCRLAQGEKYRGKCVAKRRYFYGVKVHVVTTASGLPVEFAFMPGRASDVRGLDVLALELPAGSEIFMDSGYTDYQAEDGAGEVDQVRFSVCRKKNSKRFDEPAERGYKTLMRKKIETVFSEITRLFPKRIHAVTLKGFLMKVSFFIIAFTLDRAFI